MKKIHFVGIGGIGMSALADICLSKGDIITGSDLRPNNLTDNLCRRGAVVYKGHSADNVPEDADFVVRSTCIKNDNPEITKALESGLSVFSRGEMLRRIMGEFPVKIAVTGTHGKTTTSALIAHIAEYCGKDPTVMLGGEVDGVGGNAKLGCGDMVIAEVDESDGYFRNISATCAVVTNIEKEHMEYYGCMENLVGAYGDFIRNIPAEGCCVFNGEDPLLGDLVGSAAAKKISFGICGNFDITCRNYTYAKSIDFDIVVRGRVLGRISCPLKGRYNLMNVLGSTGLCIENGFDPVRVMEAVGSFSGVRRRFDLVGRIGDIEVIEDYAHHPTELRSVITAAREYATGRVMAIFQPHRYSRTRDLLNEFSNCFDGTDILILTKIYSADEEKIEGVGIKGLYEKMDKSRFEKLELVDKNDIPAFVPGIVKNGDLILVLGAGDIREISKLLIKNIAEEKSKDV